jgi:sulfite reductase (ferredoxin)
MSDETAPGSSAPASAAKPSAVEVAKTASDYLRGDIAKELVDGAPGFGKPSIHLLKNHGTYQQDDRETRKAVDGKKSERQISFMIRTCVPGGKLSAEQLLAAIDMGDELGNGTIRLTTRQSIQHHGVVKGELKEFMQQVHKNHLTTLAACGDVERNIMCCPAPIHANPVRDEMQATLDELAKHLAPRTRAYYEIWLTDPDTGEKTLAGGNAKDAVVEPAGLVEDEPIYGRTYLPRKFKTAFALPEDNCTDVYANDLGFIVVHEGGKILGYNAPRRRFPRSPSGWASCRPKTCSRSPRRSSRCSATSATAPTARWPASSTRSTPWAWKTSGRRWRSTSASRSPPAIRPTCTASTTTSAGTSRATENSSTA